jgi:hypothetical protein
MLIELPETEQAGAGLPHLPLVADYTDFVIENLEKSLLVQYRFVVINPPQRACLLQALSGFLAWGFLPQGEEGRVA